VPIIKPAKENKYNIKTTEIRENGTVNKWTNNNNGCGYGYGGDDSDSNNIGCTSSLI
jgi:hypothetical protein